MAHHQRQVEAWQRLFVLAQEFNVSKRQSEAVHARVEVEACRSCSLAPFGDFIQRTKHRPEVMLNIVWCRTSEQAIQDVDHRIRQYGPQRGALLRQGNEKCPAPDRCQGPSDRFHAQPICVALDRGATFSGAALAGKHAPVVLNRLQVNAQRSAGQRCIQRSRGKNNRLFRHTLSFVMKERSHQRLSKRFENVCQPLKDRRIPRHSQTDLARHRHYSNRSGR